MTALTHEQARQWLHNGRRRLGNKDVAALHAHLAHCAECRTYADDLQALEPLLSQALHARWDGAQPRPPDARGERAETARQKAARGRAASPRRLSRALALAGLAVLGALALFWLRGTTAPGPGPTAIVAPATPTGAAPRPVVLQANLAQAVFVADWGEFEQEGDTVTVRSAPQIVAWGAAAGQVLWSHEVGLMPRLTMDPSGRYLFVLSVQRAGYDSVAGLIYGVNEPLRPSANWPLHLAALDPASGRVVRDVTLPAGWQQAIGVAGGRLYLYRFVPGGQLASLDLETWQLQQVLPERWKLCDHGAYPRYVQIAPEPSTGGATLYSFCTPNDSGHWWVQLLHIAEDGTTSGSREVDLPQPPDAAGDVGHWGNGMLLSPDGERLFVVDTRAGYVGEIHVHTGVVLRTTQYGPGVGPTQSDAYLALSPDGRRLYVATPAIQAPVVTVIDTTSLSQMAEAGLSSPLALSPLNTGVLLDGLGMALAQGRLFAVGLDGAVLLDGGLADGLPAIGAALGRAKTIAAYPAPPSPVAWPYFPAGEPGLIAFESSRDGNGEIYLMRADGTRPLNVTSNPARDYAPAWSPDGRYLAFISDRTGGDEVYLLFGAAAWQGGAVRPWQLTVNDAGGASCGYELAWSRDSGRLAVSYCPDPAYPGMGGGDIALLDVQGALMGATPKRLVPQVALLHGGSSPRWSPDGARLLYVGQQAPGVPAVFAYTFVPGERFAGTGPSVNLTAAEQSTAESYQTFSGFAWAPDGRQAAYLAVGPWLGKWPDSTIAPDAHARIVLVDADGANRRTLLDLQPSPNGILGLTWSPDGRYLLYLSDTGGGCWTVHLLPLAGGAPVQHNGLCHVMRTALPDWSPDSRYLLLTADWGERGQHNSEVTAFDVERTLRAAQVGAGLRLTDWPGDDFSPAWQP